MKIFHHVIFELLGQPDGRKVFDQYMEKSLLQDGKPSCFKCTLCGKQNSKNSMPGITYVESIHFPGYFSYKCDNCEKTFKSTEMHRNEKM